MKTSVRLLCLLMALMMAVSMVACGKDSSDKKTAVTTASTTTAATDSTTTTADNSAVTTTAVVDTTVGNVDQTTAADTTVQQTTTAGKATSLTLDQVLAKMPANLKGKTFNVFYWESPYCNYEGSYSEAFTKKTGIKVNFIIGTCANYATELVEKVSTGNSPDMAYLNQPSPARVQALQSLDHCNFNFNDTFWNAQSIKDYTFNNIPYAVSVTGKIDPMGVLYNSKYIEDFCKAKNLTDPYTLWTKNEWTWDNFTKICKAWKAQGTDYLGGSFCPQNLICLNYGADYIARDDNGLYTNNCNSAKLKAAWKKTLELRESGLVSKDVWKMNEFMSGKVAFFFAGVAGGCYVVGGKEDYGYRKFKLLKQLSMVPVPTDKFGTYTPIGEYCAYGIPKGAKNPEIMPYYVRYVKGQDESSLYLSNRTKEVYASIQKSMTTKGFFQMNEVITKDCGVAGGEINYQIMQSGSVSSVNKLISQYSGNVADAVDKANKQIAKFTAD